MFADIEAECQDDYMKIRIGFNGSFAGLLYSSGNFTKQTELNLGTLCTLNRITTNFFDKLLGILEFVLACDGFSCNSIQFNSIHALNSIHQNKLPVLVYL
jgi:hypothetical protein